MTLSIMESYEAYKSALKEFQTNLGEIPLILERYLDYVAKSGKPLFTWDLIYDLIEKKLETVITSYNLNQIVGHVRVSTNEMITIEEFKEDCFKSLKILNGVPFTIQRICELLLDGKKCYPRLDKFLRAFVKVIKVVSVVDRSGNKISTDEQLSANNVSPIHMDEAGDNWPTDTTNDMTSSNEVSSLNGTHTDLDAMDTSNSTDNTIIDTGKSLDGSSQISTQQNTADDNDDNNSYITQRSSMLSTSTSGNSSNTQYFTKQSSIAMPPIGALLKPIDQLEAFVQNVPVAVESTNSNNSSSTICNLDESKQPITANLLGLSSDKPNNKRSEPCDNDFMPTKRPRISNEDIYNADQNQELDETDVSLQPTECDSSKCEDEKVEPAEPAESSNKEDKNPSQQTVEGEKEEAEYDDNSNVSSTCNVINNQSRCSANENQVESSFDYNTTSSLDNAIEQTDNQPIEEQ